MIDHIKNNPKFALRVTCFVLHFSVSMVVLGFLFGCKSTLLNQDMYAMKAYDYTLYANSSMNEYTCNSTVTCFREAVPWDNNYLLDRMYWNPYTLLFVVEWVTTSIALWYISVQDDFASTKTSIIKWLSVAWNVIGWIIYLVFYTWYKQANYLEALVVTTVFIASTLLIAFFKTMVDMLVKHFYVTKENTNTQIDGRLWNICIANLVDEKQRLLTATNKYENELSQRCWVIARYFEYTCTAPLLFVTIVCIVSVDPPYWAHCIGYFCVMACCLYGVPLHIMHTLECCMDSIIEDSDKPMTRVPVIYAVIKKDTMNVDDGRLTYLHRYNEAITNEPKSNLYNIFLACINMGKWRCNWVVKIHFMQVSWISIITALGIIIYLARDILLTTGIIPAYVSAIIWLLLIFYSSFGVVSTMFYYFLDKTYWQHMDTVLDILSLACKVPIALILTFGYITMPGNVCL